MEKKTVTIFLKNGFRYTGYITDRNDLLIVFFDYKLNDIIELNKTEIIAIIPDKQEVKE